MKRLLSILIIFIVNCPFTIGNPTVADSLKVMADSAYAQENFDRAAKLYQRIAKSGESAVICYNLGNCYYRKDDIAHAILWYERASILSPGDSDIRFNLDMARSHTIDRITPQHEFFFISWYHSMVNWMSVDAWAMLAVVLFVCFLLTLAIYIYADSLWMRKAGFTLAIVSLLLTLLCNVCAWSQRDRLIHRSGAIVMSPSAVVKSTPAASGSDLFVLHEGTYVSIRDKSINNWYEVTLADGKQGWIERRQVEEI